MDDADGPSLVSPFDPAAARTAFGEAFTAFWKASAAWTKQANASFAHAPLLDRRSAFRDYEDIVGDFRQAVQRIDSWPESAEVALSRGRLLGRLEHLQAAADEVWMADGETAYAARVVRVADEQAPVRELMVALYGWLGGTLTDPHHLWTLWEVPDPVDFGLL